ncbi:DUF5344 family protein [Metabacillus fastidiosus]|uniref:DUF5344 family protein n=1 Tax=Metabacillus fastidiosus TaxID=1458 RepID=UPI002E2043BC|nr:DUF5344 family protein [Metabacillus fastidiosus]
MGQELKVRYADVEVTVSKIDSRIGALQPNLGKEVSGGSKLDVVTKLNELNALLEEVGEVYKQILQENNQAVRKTLQELKETDTELSSRIQSS